MEVLAFDAVGNHRDPVRIDASAHEFVANDPGDRDGVIGPLGQPMVQFSAHYP